MAAKGKNKVESEVERLRAVQHWDKAIEITKTQLTKTSNGLDVLTSLLQGEKELELYLQDNPANEENVEKAKTELASCEKNLRYVIQRAPKDRESLRQEAVLLLGKLYFAQARFTQALHEFDSINLDTLTLHTVTNRMLKILAEGLAVKAMCMEKMLEKSSSADKNVNMDQIIKYYERAGDILLLFLQNRDATVMSSSPMASTGQVTVGSGGSGLLDDSLGFILETAIQKSPLIYIEKGQIAEGVGRFRQLLRAVGSVNSRNLYRMMLARQLAEVLLRGICSSTYPPINSASPSKPAKGALKAKQYDSPNMFVPSTEEEEAILLLLIAEGMANKEALLDRKPENAQRRSHAFQNTTAVYDLLTIALVRRCNCTILAEVLERAMKFSYEEVHVWYQFALSLMETEKYERAYLVLKECHRLKPTDPTILLLQAKLCYERLHQTDDGIAVSKKACDICDDDITKSKALMMLGTGYSLKLESCRVRNKREQLLQLTLETFTKAHELDSYNADASFLLALHLAQQRKLGEALKYTTYTLKLQPDKMCALTLLSLIFSAEKKYEKALEVIKIALGDYPDTLTLLLVKSKLESSLGLFKQSLSTCAQMLRVWKQEYMHAQDLEKKGTGLLEKFTSSDSNKAFIMVSDLPHDQGSVYESQAASRVEKALSEVASSTLSSIWLRHGPQHSWALQSHIWLHLAEIYLENGHKHESNACVQEALSMYPFSHVACYMKGRVLESQENYVEAKCHFESALSVNPYHVKSMTYLGRCFHMLGKTQLAEKTLRDAVNTDPTCHDAWRELGVVLELAQEYDTAGDCLMTSINLECSTPVIPFGILQRA